MTKTVSAKTAPKTVEKKATKAQVASKTTTPKQKPLIAPNEKISLTITWTELDKPYRQTVGKLAKSAKIEGFRQGKAPLDKVEAKVGFNKIVELVLRDILPEKYVAAIKEAKKQPVTAPEYHLVSLDKGQDWIIEAEFAQAPSIDLKGYEKHLVAGKKAAEKFIKEQNEKMAKQAKEKTAESKNKKAPAAPEKLSPDQEKEIFYQHLLRELTVNIRPSIAELLLRQETQQEFARLKQQLDSYKIAVEDYLKQRQITIEDLSNELAGTVLNRLQIDFILAAIAKERQIKVDAALIEAELATIEDEKLREQIAANPEYRAGLEAQLLRRLTIESLLK